jgi:hypothetical protein
MTPQRKDRATRVENSPESLVIPGKGVEPTPGFASLRRCLVALAGRNECLEKRVDRKPGIGERWIKSYPAGQKPAMIGVFLNCREPKAYWQP